MVGSDWNVPHDYTWPQNAIECTHLAALWEGPGYEAIGRPAIYTELLNSE